MPSDGYAIIFDLDGTVWDSEPGIVSCLRETLEVFEVEPPADRPLTSFLGPPLNTMLAQLGVPEPLVDEARLEYRRRYREHGEFECVVYDGIPELLEDLNDAGLAVGVATSKGDEIVARMLDHFGLSGFFRTVRAASMTAAGHGKIELVGGALADLGADDGVMIGDRSYDIEGGRHHGLVAVGVRWGYADPGELEAAGAHHVVDTVDELAGLLRRR